MIYFTFEYVLRLEKVKILKDLFVKMQRLLSFSRFSCAPRKLKFMAKPLNVVDLFAIIPFFLTFFLNQVGKNNWKTKCNTYDISIRA